MFIACAVLAVASVFAAWNLYFKFKRDGYFRIALTITLIQAFFINFFGRYNQ